MAKLLYLRQQKFEQESFSLSKNATVHEINLQPEIWT